MLGPATFEVDLAKVTTPCGFSFHPDGWHPYRDTIEELLADPDVAYEHTTLARYYERFQGRTVQEALLEEVTEPLEPIRSWPALGPLFTRPWGITPRYLARILQDPERHRGVRQQLGPQIPAIGRAQVERLARSYESLRSGYRSEEYPDGFLAGYFLVPDGDYRFVVLHGNHRVPAFEKPGITRPRATIHRGHPPVVDADRLGRWTRGKYGVHQLEVAELLFDKMFAETGREKSTRHGLL